MILICQEHGPFEVAPSYLDLFREGECFEVSCPSLDVEGNPHFVPAQIRDGRVIERVAVT